MKKYSRNSLKISFTSQVVARGSIVHWNINTPRENNVESSEQLAITQKMVPSARIVAYYLQGTEIVSNSAWFDVVDQCKEVMHFCNCPKLPCNIYYVTISINYTCRPRQ